MGILGVDHIAIICSSIDISKDFYVGVLGCKVVFEEYRAERNSHRVILSIPGTMTTIELFTFPDSPLRLTYPETLGLRHFAFLVGSVAKLREKLIKGGIECEEVRIGSRTGRKFFFAKDPDGLPIEFMEAV